MDSGYGRSIVNCSRAIGAAIRSEWLVAFPMTGRRRDDSSADSGAPIRSSTTAAARSKALRPFRTMLRPAGMPAAISGRADRTGEERAVLRWRAVAVAMMANALQQMSRMVVELGRPFPELEAPAADRMAKSRACLQRDTGCARLRSTTRQYAASRLRLRRLHR